MENKISKKSNGIGSKMKRTFEFKIFFDMIKEKFLIYSLSPMNPNDPFFTGRPVQPQNPQQPQQIVPPVSIPQQTPVQPQVQISPQPQQIPTQPVMQVNKINPVSQTKQGSKVSFAGFAIGCGIFVVVLTGAFAFMLYNFIQNPSQLASLGLSLANAKMLLQTFVVLFFGFLFFAGFAVTALNGYRLVSKTEGGKAGYAVGLLFGMMLVIGAIFWGSQVLTIINKIWWDQQTQTSNVVKSFYQMKNGKVFTETPGLRLIAPGVINFDLNRQVFGSLVGQNKLDALSLDCGNGQILDGNPQNGQFESVCLYLKKGNYQLKLNYTTTDRVKNESKKQTVDAGILNFESEIALKLSAGGELQLNDQKTELKAWDVPTRVLFDATSLFTDFGLKDYKINWNVSGGTGVEQVNTVQFSYNYTTPKLHEVVFSLPDLNQFVYVFNIRVNQWNAPICTFTGSVKKDNTYSFDTLFEDKNAQIVSYEYHIIDISTNKIIKKIPATNPSIEYTFPQEWSYTVVSNFTTVDGATSSCSSEPIVIGPSQYQVFYEMSTKIPSAPKFIKVWAAGPVSLTWDLLIVTTLPTISQLKILSIKPESEGLDIKVNHDGKPLATNDQGVYEFTIVDPKEQFLTITIKDKNGKITTKTITIEVNQPKIIGAIKVTPNTVGTEPFEVQLDASVTKLTDPSDEIVYFTWNFWDGQVSKNISQGSITHIYRFDKTKESWEYKPFVIIKTKKGLEQTITLNTPIIVKRTQKQITLTTPSHSSQVASVGDVVQFSLETDGLVKQIDWDFGNTKALTCQSRECIDTSTIFDKPGDYTVRATVKYEDYPDVMQTIKIKVN